MTEFTEHGLTVRCALPHGLVRRCVYVILGDEGFDHLAEALWNSNAALIGISGMEWNDLSPWPAPPVFRDQPFTGKAMNILEKLEGIVSRVEGFFADAGGPLPVQRILCGYSLAGLFALWSGFHTQTFSGVCSVSGSLWFDGFSEWMQAHMADFKPGAVYLSLGDRQARARDPRMARVGSATEYCAELLRQKNISLIYEMNPGGHFQNPQERLLKGILAMTGTPDPCLSKSSS